MTSREKWKLRGLVRTCCLNRTSYSPACGGDSCAVEEHCYTTRVEFREDGSVLGADADQPGVTWELDTEGCKRKILRVDAATQMPNTTYYWGVDGSDSSYTSPGAATVTTSFNRREYPVQLSFHDVAGNLLSQVNFTYDGAGNLIEEAQTTGVDLVPPDMLHSLTEAEQETMRGLLSGRGNLRVHRYDDRGRRIETQLTLGPLSTQRTTFTYNDHDDVVEETFEIKSQEYGIDEEGRLSEKPLRENTSHTMTRFSYEYDARGNWITKIVESRSAADADFTHSCIEHRTLEYFD